MARDFGHSTQFGHGMCVLVPSKTEVSKFLDPVHKHRRRLPAALVAASQLARLEHGHKALRKREAGGAREGFRHRLNCTLADQHISLYREVRSGNMSKPIGEMATAPRGAAACCVHNSELPNVFARVRVDQRIERLLGGVPLSQQL